MTIQWIDPMRLRLKRLATALLLAAVLAPNVARASDEPPVSVMVLGTYHFGNPGLDVNNVKADDVLTTQRQTELDAVAQALLAFRPTKVMVERESDAPDLADTGYAQFTPAMLGTKRNETVQIGYRIANLAGLTKVYGIDEQPKSGEPDYFPFGPLMETAKRLGKADLIGQANQPVQAWLKAFETKQKTSSIAELLIEMNDLSTPAGSMDFYYDMLRIGDKDVQSGADLNAMWYLRNAKIFSKLMLASQKGDRVLVIYGGGHGYWLRHFASMTRGYRVVDPAPYLKRAKKTAKRRD